MKLRLSTSLIQSVLLYRSESWAQRKTDKNHLQAFQVKARHILQSKWNDFIIDDLVRVHMKLSQGAGEADRVARLSPSSSRRTHQYMLHSGSVHVASHTDLELAPGHPHRLCLEQVLTDQDCTAGEIWSSNSIWLCGDRYNHRCYAQQWVNCFLAPLCNQLLQ